MTEVSSAAELAEAVKSGGIVVLNDDVKLEDAPLTISGNTVVNLNGNTLSGVSTSSTTSNMIKVDSGAALTLTGEGIVSFAATTPDTNWGGDGQPAFPGYANNTISLHGTLIIEGVTVENKTAAGGASYAIDCYPGANLIVNGGTINGYDKVAVRTFANSVTTPINVTVNGGELVGRRAIWVQLPGSNANQTPVVNVNMNNGVLKAIDEVDNLAIYSYSYGQNANGVTLNLNGGTVYGNVAVGGGSKVGAETVNLSKNCAVYGDVFRYLADGTEESIQATTYVVADTATEVTNALAAGNDVIFATDIEAPVATTAPYGNKLGIAQNGGTLDGNGKELMFNSYSGDNYGIMTSGGTIKNVTIGGAFRGIVVMNAQEDVIIDNVIIDDEYVCYALNTAEGDGTQNVIVSNSTLKGWTSIGNTVKSVSFTNCTFGQGTYYTNVYGRLVKPYVNAVFENCEFGSMYYIDLSALAADQTVTLRNCTVNGVKLTAENWTTLVAPESDCGAGQISIELRGGTYMTATNVADYVIFE